jgi:hypothetical protein
LSTTCEKGFPNRHAAGASNVQRKDAAKRDGSENATPKKSHGKTKTEKMMATGLWADTLKRANVKPLVGHCPKNCSPML